MDEQHKDQLDAEELERENGELLPDRAAMSLIADPSGFKMPPALADSGGGITTLPVEPTAAE